jgi:hypothetical protein
MCNFCKGEYYSFKNYNVFIDKGDLNITHYHNDHIWLEINFCPICGKNLNSVVDKEE